MRFMADKVNFVLMSIVPALLLFWARPILPIEGYMHVHEHFAPDICLVLEDLCVSLTTGLRSILEIVSAKIWFLSLPRRVLFLMKPRNTLPLPTAPGEGTDRKS